MGGQSHICIQCSPRLFDETQYKVLQQSLFSRWRNRMDLSDP